MSNDLKAPMGFQTQHESGKNKIYKMSLETEARIRSSKLLEAKIRSGLNQMCGEKLLKCF